MTQTGFSYGILPQVIRTSTHKGTELFGTSARGACTVRLTRPSPLIAVALHAGAELLPLSARNVRADAVARRREEDPYTDEFIADFPVTVVANHSRFAYDVNRSPERAVARGPEDVWGLDLWKSPPSEAQRGEALACWNEVYEIIDAVVGAAVERFGVAVVLDCHSYNLERRGARTDGRPWPLFDVGTNLVADRHRSALDAWVQALGQIELPGQSTVVGQSWVYGGDGHLVKFLRDRHPEALTLPTEVGKVYMDERTGEPHEDHVRALRRQLPEAAAAPLAALQALGKR